MNGGKRYHLLYREAVYSINSAPFVYYARMLDTLRQHCLSNRHSEGYEFLALASTTTPGWFKNPPRCHRTQTN